LFWFWGFGLGGGGFFFGLALVVFVVPLSFFLSRTDLHRPQSGNVFKENLTSPRKRSARGLQRFGKIPCLLWFFFVFFFVFFFFVDSPLPIRSLETP